MPHKPPPRCPTRRKPSRPKLSRSVRPKPPARPTPLQSPCRCWSITTWRTSCRRSSCCRVSAGLRICRACSCTAASTWCVSPSRHKTLADVWPGAQLSIVDAAGHWTFEPGNVTALKAGGEYLARTLDAKPTADPNARMKAAATPSPRRRVVPSRDPRRTRSDRRDKLM
jgi:hypothetical protein